tara:strand:- start:296 stop:475 length:180 start_codon:yes stop_codon:yes gene_type:complete
MKSKKEIWLFISAFGIMFAVLSWLQEAQIIPDSNKLGFLKGIFAIITGLFLYLFFRKSL